MSKIDDIKAELTKLDITFDENAKLSDLKALLPKDDELSNESDSDEIEVSDPMILRPKELPLVVKLPSGASKAQHHFAATLNAYAYKNPEKWASKKDDKNVNGTVVKGLITKLKDLKDAPDPVEVDGGIKYSNKLLEN